MTVLTMTRVGKKSLPDVYLHAEDRFPHFNVVSEHWQCTGLFCWPLHVRTNQWGQSL